MSDISAEDKPDIFLGFKKVGVFEHKTELFISLNTDRRVTERVGVRHGIER